MSKCMDRSSVVVSNAVFLCFVSVAHSTQLEFLIHSSINSQLRAVCEIVLNYLTRNIESSENFEHCTDFFRTLASKGVSLAKKKAFLTNSNDFWQSLKYDKIYTTATPTLRKVTGT